MNLIAEQEGIRPRQQKKWDAFLGEFGSVAFAMAPLYSTFPHQNDRVSCHPACLLILHCLLSRRDIDGMQLPQDRLWLLREIAQATLHYRDFVHPWHGCMLGPIVHLAVHRAFVTMTESTSRALNVEFISVPYMLPFCFHRRYVWHCANGECHLLPHLHALYWHLRWVTGLRLIGRL